MSHGAKSAKSIVEELSTKLIQAKILKDFVRWLTEDKTRLVRANRMLQIMRLDTANELKLRPTDLFRHGHLTLTQISAAAEERANDREDGRPHVKACTLCNAFIEVEAAQIVLQKGMQTDPSGVSAKVLRKATDNDKWFGRTPDSRL